MASPMTDDVYQLWEAGEPSGERFENCLASVGNTDMHKYQDVSCSKEFCGICNLEDDPVYTLRGK